MSTMIGEIYRRHLPEKVVEITERHEMHVLAVDDSNVDRKVIERLLKISSCKVTVVDSGSRALQFLGLDGEKSSVAAFDDLKVNLIMTDYSMPGMTGYELLKKIKKSSAFREVPVVIMSSENILARIDRCLEEGAEEFIVKPVKLSDVKRLKDVILKGDIHKVEPSVSSSCKRNFEEAKDDRQFASPSPSILPDLSRKIQVPSSSPQLMSCDLSRQVQKSSPHCPSKRPKIAIET